MTSHGDFSEFVAAQGSGLLRTAFLLTGDRTAAEDLLQDVLERAFVRWRRIDDPLPYVRSALVNRAANRWRGRSRRPEARLERSHDMAVPDGAEDRAERDRLMQAIWQLPPRQRAVLVLRYFHDLTEEQTAYALQCSVGTVKSQTSRALSRLRVEPALTADASDERGIS